jgi:hypothetical protein
MVMDHFFGPGNPGALFKRPANIYNFHDTIMASVAFHAEQVTKPGAHSSLTNRDDFEDVSLVDQLAVKIHQSRGGFKTRRVKFEEEEEGGF